MSAKQQSHGPYSEHHLLWGILLVFLVSGCSSVTSWLDHAKPEPEPGSNPVLRPVQMKSDAIVLDIFFVRRSQTDPVLNDSVWRDARDIQLSVELRKQLRMNGFRVGILSRHISDQLAELLELTDKDLGTTDKPVEGQMDFTKQQSVMRRYVELSQDRPTEILSSDIYEELMVLLKEGLSVGGKTYNDAQCVFRVDCKLLPKGSVRLLIQPELQYGQSRQQYSVQQGVVQFDFGRNKRSFPLMNMDLELNLGEMLIMSCEPGRGGSLGSQFFADSSREDYQKLLVIRLARTQHDGLFPAEGIRPGETLPFDNSTTENTQNNQSALVVTPVTEGDPIQTPNEEQEYSTENDWQQNPPEGEAPQSDSGIENRPEF